MVFASASLKNTNVACVARKKMAPMFMELTSLFQKVKLAIARLIDAYQDGLLSRDEFQPRITRSKERLKKLEEEASALTSQQSEADELRLAIGHLQDFQRHLHEGLMHVDWKTKREIIRALVNRVEIGDQFVRVVYRVSPPPFASGPASGACLQHCGRREWTALRSPFVSRDADALLH